MKTLGEVKDVITSDGPFDSFYHAFSIVQDGHYERYQGRRFNIMGRLYVLKLTPINTWEFFDA